MRRMVLPTAAAWLAGAMLGSVAVAQEAGQVLTGGAVTPPAPTEGGVTLWRGSPVPLGAAPVGIEAGQVNIYPAITAGLSYTDNFFKTKNNKEGEWEFDVTPSVVAISQLPRHAYALEASVTGLAPFGETDDRRVAATLGGSGRLDLTPVSSLSGELGYTRTFEERGSPDLPGAAREPTGFHLIRGSTSYDHRFQRTGVRVGANVSRFFYDDTDIVGGGQLPTSDRDRTSFGGSTRVSYALNPRYDVFLQGNVNRTQYDSSTVFGRDRDSTGIDGLVGVSIDVGPRLRGEVGVGAGHVFYDDSASDDKTGYRANGALTWVAGPATMVTSSIAANHEETTLNASGSLTTTAALDVSHRVAVNTLLRGGGFYQRRDYHGLSRDDDVVGGNVGVSYFLNRIVSLGLDYRHQSRFSNVSGAEYSENRVTFRVTAAR